MKIKLVFDDWQKFDGKQVTSVYQTNQELSYGNFHSGTVFEAEIHLAPDEKEELEDALNKKFMPIFRVTT